MDRCRPHVADAVSSYWVNFAANGNPNGKGVPKWTAYDGKTSTVTVFGNPPQGGAVSQRGATYVLSVIFRKAEREIESDRLEWEQNA